MEEQHNELPRDSDDPLHNIGTYDPKLDLSAYEYLPQQTCRL